VIRTKAESEGNFAGRGGKGKAEEGRVYEKKVN
jgi:hypothetical protein